MTKQLSQKLFLIALSLSVSSCAVFQPKETKTAAPTKTESKDKNGIKPYDKVITKEAKSDKGLFTVHKVDENYFYEIPDSLLNREMLTVTRIAKTANGIGFWGWKTGYSST